MRNKHTSLAREETGRQLPTPLAKRSGEYYKLPRGVQDGCWTILKMYFKVCIWLIQLRYDVEVPQSGNKGVCQPPPLDRLLETRSI